MAFKKTKLEVESVEAASFPAVSRSYGTTLQAYIIS